MSDLPLGWIYTTLDEVLAVEDRAITDGPFGSKLASRHYTRSGARVIRLQNIGDCVFNNEHAYISLDYFEELRAHEVRSGDLVIASLGQDLPRACIIPVIGEPAIVKADCIRARIHPGLEKKWILYALSAPQTKQHAASRIRGIGRPRLGLGEMRKLPIPLPPLGEQLRIITALEDHLSRVSLGDQNLRQVRLRSSALRRSLLGAAVSGRLVSRGSSDAEEWLSKVVSTRPEFSKKYKPSVLSAKIPGYELPDGWAITNLDTISYAFGYGTSTRSDFGAAGDPVLRIPNIQRGEIILDNLKNAVDSSIDLSSLHVDHGDMLFIRTNGSRDLIGRAGVVRKSLKIAYASYLIRFRLIPNGIPADWVLLVVSSPPWRAYLEHQASSSAGQYNLNVSNR